MTKQTWFLVAALSLAPVAASAQEEKSPDPETRARVERRGGGVRVGPWWPRDLAEEPGVATTQTPAFEAWGQKGLDLHLAVESAVGYWSRSQVMERTDAFGGTTRQQVQTYVVPLFAGLKAHPLTTPGAGLEPYLLGAIGVALGVDDRSGDGGPLGEPAGTTAQAGFGFKAGAGLDVKLGRAFGVTFGARYQWLRFGEALGGERTYRGVGLDVGLTYRFQYR